MKKGLAILLAMAMLVCLLAGCGGNTSGDTSSQNSAGTEGTSGTDKTDLSGVTLEVAVTYTGDQATMFEQVVADFEEEYGCTVNLDEYGDDYENTLKTRMASNDLPDVWQTHGWSLIRYKEYLMDLSDQAWVSDYDDSALGVIQDDSGSLYVLMISELINGTLVNLDVCDKAGVDPYSIKTWDDFTDACAKIKTAGYTPIGSTSNAGLMANYAGTWVSYDGELAQDSDAMLAGTWDWTSYKPMLNAMAGWMDNGYFYDDILTMSSTDFTERFASSKAAFCLGNDPSVFINCLALNAGVNYAFLPDFASKEGGDEFVGIGEGSTFGIWKDTKNEAAAKTFLEYLAQPDVALTINESTGMISCLKSTMAIDQSAGLQYFKTMKEKCANDKIFYENLWDRKYMPSGMWDIFGTGSNMLFADHSATGINTVLQYMQENYADLYAAAQEG